MNQLTRSYSSTSTPSTICIGGSSRVSGNHSKVIKGEIHNVLSVMRADARYASPHRFSSEFISNNDSEHPLISSLKELNEYLSKVSSSLSSSSYSSINTSTTTTTTTTATSSNARTTERQPINSLRYLSPFCTAVSSRDVSAPITGAALSALHKFLLYGFIDPDLVDDAKEGITIVARAIRHCSFEENTDLKKSVSSSNSSSGRNYRTSSLQIDGGKMSSSTSKKGYLGNRSTNTNTTTSLHISDEEVVLKLLSLASLVIRSPAGISLLDSSDIVGIFDTCLHVATFVGDKASSLLQSAATDCLGSIVLVVFGNISLDTSHSTDDIAGMSNSNAQNNALVNDDNDSEGSDDLWGQIDPDLNGEKVEDTSGIMTTGIIANAPPSPLIGKLRHPNQQEQQQDKNTQQSDTATTNTKNVRGGPVPALVTIMSRLAYLANPLANPDHTCVQALQLINIALETAPADHLSHHQDLLDILSGTLCKHLLYLSTTPDLVILSLTLRVVFNLFNSIKNHLKVQLEVFLSSVHLRILDSTNDMKSSESAFSPEQREIALEGLLEFCHEPALMMDLYMNYDCDVQSTNLFETICRVLANVSTGRLSSEDAGQDGSDKEHDQDEQKSTSSQESVSSTNDEDAGTNNKQLPLNALNTLAFEGILAVIDSIARRCELLNHDNGMTLESLPKLDDIDDEVTRQAYFDSPNSPRKSYESSSLYSSDDSESDSIGSLDGESLSSPRSMTTGLSSDSPLDLWISMSPDQKKQSSKILSQRKRQKHRLAATVAKFNKKPTGKEWIQFGVSVGVVDLESPQSIANFLYNAPNLDKSQIGIYLSKGPKEKYPFNSQVLKEFLALFDIEDLEFSDALRLFLLKFRLPGEAQCIDRLMEAFAARLFEQQQHDIQKHSMNGHNQDDQRVLEDETGIHSEPSESLNEEPVEKNESDETDSLTLSTKDDTSQEATGHVETRTSLFGSADSIFILAFSTIMLNTDLHNPNMDDEKRMTLEQFIRNNRGINDGKDFPVEFMTTLYKQIKESEIQVQRDVTNVIGDGGIHQWDGIFSSSREPFFSSIDVARCSIEDAGIHERDMFTVIFDNAVKSLSFIATHSFDDSLVMKSFQGFSQMAKICEHLKLDNLLNHILEVLLGFGREHVINFFLQQRILGIDGNEFPIPNISHQSTNDNETNINEFEHDAIRGSAHHRGLLSTECALMIVKAHPTSISEAFPSLLQTIFFLRDINALPTVLAELDDFADSNGKILAPSPYAMACKQQVNECVSSLFSVHSDINEDSANVSYWPFSFARSGRSQIDRGISTEDTGGIKSNAFFNHPSSQKIASKVHNARLDQILVGKKEKVCAQQMLLSMLQAAEHSAYDIAPYKSLSDVGKAVLYEHHAVYSLELAARLLFANRDYALELFPLFISKFEVMIKNATIETIATQDEAENVSNPFLMERIIVTILRSCIHLADRPSIHQHLMKSLTLLFYLPPHFLFHISSRLGCGMAIFLRSSYSQLTCPDEWKIIGDLVDLCAHFEPGRRFIFDGVASCVEDCFPDPKTLGNRIDPEDMVVTYDGASLFARFLLKIIFGSYDGDLSLAVGGIHCLNKVYWYLYYLTIEPRINEDQHMIIPDEDLWCSVCSAYYSVSLLDHPESVSMDALDLLEKLISATEVIAVTADGWLRLLENMATKQSDIIHENPRIKTFNLSCRVLLKVAPKINESVENLKALKDIVSVMAIRAGENLKAGRKGSVSPLFESTVEILTNTLNVMSVTEFNNNNTAFRGWATEVLSEELVKVGAVGGLGQTHITPFDLNQLGREE